MPDRSPHSPSDEDDDGDEPVGHRDPAGDAVEADEVTDVALMLERFERGGRVDGDGGGYEPVTLVTNRGDIAVRYYAAARAFGGAPPPDVPPRTAAAAPGAIFLPGYTDDDSTGTARGFGSPVRGQLYPRLARELSALGVGCLHVAHRRPDDFEQCVLDVLAALAFCDEEDIGPVAVFGHSAAGPVAMHAGLLSPAVVACAALAAVPYGAADVAEHLGPRCALLVAHGTADAVVPVDAARAVYRAAGEPKRLVVKAGAGHGLDEWAAELPALLRDWATAELRRAWDTRPGGT